MKNEIILYQPNNETEHIEVFIDERTVWLNQDQITQLFQRDQSVISRHIRNIFKEGELDKKSNMQKMHIANSDKPVAFYNLDVIISVGYRVKSKQGTQFRICIRAEPRKPAKRTADVMQGGKERACELLLRPCSHTAERCGLEGGDRRRRDNAHETLCFLLRNRLHCLEPECPKN